MYRYEIKINGNGFELQTVAYEKNCNAVFEKFRDDLMGATKVRIERTNVELGQVKPIRTKLQLIPTTGESLLTGKGDSEE